jgi:hypothetical protein
VLSHRSQRPFQSDQGHEDECDGSNEDNDTVNITHRSLSMPADLAGLASLQLPPLLTCKCVSSSSDCHLDLRYGEESDMLKRIII